VDIVLSVAKIAFVLLVIGGLAATAIVTLRRLAHAPSRPAQPAATGDEHEPAPQSFLTRDERADGARRARSIEQLGRKDAYVAIAVASHSGTAFASTTHRTAYALMARGIDTKLEMLEMYVERGGGSIDPSVPRVAERITYTTSMLAPHLRSISSLEGFARYVPFRPDHRIELSVHSDDVEGAYRLLRELGIALNPMMHPDQAR
jgi:hypothetical protein